jgi:hypothetical protein
MVAISIGRNYDEVLEEVRRQNLRPVNPPEARTRGERRSGECVAGN